MGNKLLPLLVVVLLCFTSFVAAAGTFTVTTGSNTTVGSQSWVRVQPDAITTPVQVTITNSDGTFSLSVSQNVFFDTTPWTVTLTAAQVGKGTFVFAVNNAADYTAPASVYLYVFVTVSYNSFSFYPGNSVDGTISLGSSPATGVHFTFVASSSDLIFKPNSFTFSAGQAPYSLSYTITSTEPGTYSYWAVADGTDAPFVQTPTYNASVSVDKRLIYTNPATTFYNKVGQQTQSILVSLDVAPDVGLNVNVIPSDNTVMANPSTLSFNPAVTALSYTLTGSAPASASITYNFTGADKDKYAISSTPYIYVSNRTVSVPSFSSVLIGVTSNPYTFYVADAPPSDHPLYLTLSSPDQLVFSPSQLKFTSSSAVATTVITASNASRSSAREIDFALSGDYAWWFTPLASTFISISATIRHVNLVYSWDPSNLPFGKAVTITLSLDNIPPSQFTVSFSGANIDFSPSSVTFSNSTGGLTQTISLTPNALGSSRIFFTISGTDAALVADISSIGVTVVKYQAPYLSIGQLTVGVPQQGTLYVPSPVIDSLTITLSATPVGSDVTITPSVFDLSPPGYGAGQTAYTFTVLSNDVGSIVLHGALSGPDADAGLFPPVSDDIVNVVSASFDSSQFNVPSNIYVNVPITGLRITLDVAHTSTVTLTPSAATFKFDPPAFTFDAETSVVCVTVTPTVAPLAQETIVFTSSDPVNYVAPSPIIVYNIMQKTFDISQLAGSSQSLTIGATSNVYRVAVNYPPASTVTLTPASTDGLQFSPTALTFDTNTEYQYFTITPTSLANTKPVITWSDDSSEFATPSPVTSIVVNARSLMISDSYYANTEVGQVSPPVVVSTDLPVPGAGLTITPSAPGVTFVPASAVISGTTTFVAFSAQYPVWQAPDDYVSLQTQYVLSGPYSAWFSSVSNYVQFHKRYIYYSTYGFSVTTKQAAYPLTVTLDVAPESDITLTFCAASVVVFNPPALTFGPGQTTATVLVSATDFLGTSPISNAFVSTDVTGTNANSYYEPDDFNVNINTIGSIVLSNFPSSVTIGDGATPFEIYIPFREALPSFTVTFMSQGGLTFMPSSVTFDNTDVHFFVSVQPTNLVHFAGGSSTETVTFEITGVSGIFGTIAPRTVTINKRYFNYNIPNTESYVGEVLPGCITLSYPPSEGTTLTLTPITTPVFTIAPSSLVFTSTTTTQCFVASSNFLFGATLGWEISGSDASFYQTPSTVGYYFDQRYVSLDTSSVTIQPGRLNGVTFYLYSAVVNDLTITPVLPSPLTATPSSLTLKAGEAIGSMFFSISGNMRTSDYSFINFLLSGTDAPWYSLTDQISVYVGSGTIDVSSISSPEVGLPADPVYLTLYPVTINGLTVTFNGSGVVFDPPSVTFSPGESTARVIITPIRTGSIPIGFELSGPDSWLYNVPSSSIYSNLRSIYLGLNSPQLQVKQAVQLYLSNAPRNTLEITPISDNLQFDQDKYVFDNTVDSWYISYTPLTCGYQRVTFEFGGDDVTWYNTLDLQPWVSFTSCIQINFDSPSNLLDGVPVYGRAYVSAPATFTLTPNAPGCTYDPPMFEFDDNTLSVAYSVTCDVGAPTEGTGIPIMFTVGGTDKGLIQQPVVDDDLYIVANMLTVPNTLEGVYSGQPYTFEVSLTYPVTGDVTVTPMANNADITPESITFSAGAGQATSGFFTVTPSSPTFVNIRYQLDGDGSSSVGVNYAMTSFGVNYGSISWGFSVAAVQESYGPYNVILYPPSINGVTFTPSAPGCTFTPAAAEFTQFQDVVQMFVSCASVGSPYISFDISGNDAIHYQDPGYSQVSVLARTISLNFDTTEPQIFDTRYGYLYLRNPPNTGLVLTPTAASITFSPATINVPAGASTVPFSYSGGALGSDVVVWELSGDDAEYYTTPSYTSFDVDYRYISPYMPNFGNIYAGSWSNPFSIVLDRAPDTGLTITLYGAGITFDPPALEFGPGETGKAFVLKPTANIEGQIYFDLSGEDAQYYAQPDNIWFDTALIEPSFDTDSYDQPTVGVVSPPLLVYTNYPPSSSVTITFTGSGTFDPPSVTLGPTSSAAVFTFTPNAVGYTTIAGTVSGASIGDFQDVWFETYQFYVDKRRFHTMYNFPDLVANVPSSTLSLALDFTPPTGFQVIPSAPGFTFTPSTLQFSPDSTHAEFTMICDKPTHYNNAPDQFGNLAQTQISWQLAGDDAWMYVPPDPYYVSVLPRDLTITYYSNQYLLVPFSIEAASRYPPNSSLVITPVGNFQFDQETYTLTPDQPSVVIWATPLNYDSASFKLLVSGDDAPRYQAVDWQGVGVNKWYFIFPNFQGYQYGEWSAPQVIRVNNVPSQNVTLTPTSDYLDFRPQTLTFGPGNPSAQVEILLRKGNNFLRTSSHTVHFWVGGPAAYLFDTPSALTINLGFSNPPRYLTVFNFPNTLTVGVPVTNIVVRLPNFPVDSLVVTPVPYSPHIVFSPSSLTFNRTSTDLAASFSVWANHPTQGGQIQFALSGLDAGFYQAYSAYIYSISLRQISFSTQTLTVGTPSQPFIASLPYPTPNGFSFRLSSQSIAFNPPVITFLPNTSTAAFTATGGTVGSSIPVKAVSWGPDADWHTPPSVSFSTLNVNPRYWSITPGSRSLNPSVPSTLEYALNDPPITWLSITPWAPGVSFTPATAILYPNSSSVWFTVVGNVGGTSVPVNTILDGPDAKLYYPVNQYTITITELSLYADNLGGDLNIDLWEQRDVRIRLSGAAVNGLTVTPTGANLVFNPPSVFIPPGHLYAHCSYTATAPGLSSVRIQTSGPDQLLFYVNQPAGNIRVYPLYLSVSTPPSILVGSTSAPVTVFARGAATGIQRANNAPVNVTFLVAPPTAATIHPPVVTIYPPYSTFQISVTANIVTDVIAISTILSGPGAANYQSFPGSSPNLITFSAVKRSFTLTDLFNYLGNTNQRQFVVGELSPFFSVTALSVPSDVSLYLTAPGLQFIPSVLRFTGTYETLYFQILPVTPGLTQITLSLGGTDAPLFNVPVFPGGSTGVSAQLRVTHNFVVPSLPSVTIGQLSPTLEVAITSPFSSPVVVVPTVPTCSSGTGYVTFLPPYFIITPNSTVQKFQYIGNCATFNLGANYNPVITGTSPRQYTTSPTVVSVQWRITEAGESSAYALSFTPLTESVLAVNVLPGTFNVAFKPLKLGDTSSVNISVTVPPRSDVVLTLVANNLNFNPPHVTFFPHTTSVEIEVTPVHSDFKDSQNIPFTVDYIISGSNWADYVPPAQTFLGVSKGDGAVVGGICGSDAAVTRVGVWFAVFMIAVMLWQ